MCLSAVNDWSAALAACYDSNVIKLRAAEAKMQDADWLKSAPFDKVKEAKTAVAVYKHIVTEMQRRYEWLK